MSPWRSLVPTLILCLLSVQSHAVTGSATINATCDGLPNDPVNCGYFPGILGSITNPTLSDGMTISEFLDQGYVLTFSVSGFTSDPGSSYINSIHVDCLSPPSSMPSSSATYAYSPTSGQASWTWFRSYWCIFRPSPRTITVS